MKLRTFGLSRQRPWILSRLVWRSDRNLHRDVLSLLVIMQLNHFIKGLGCLECLMVFKNLGMDDLQDVR
jgi:hypothetical protein